MDLTNPRMVATIRQSAALALATLMLAGACTSGSQPAADTSHTLTVLAGSELKDLAPLLPDLQKATGYTLQLRYTGSLDGAEAIVNGDKADMAWFSSGNYLTLLEGSKGRIIAQQPIMLSPVVIGVKHSVAQSLGWAGSPRVTWADIANAAKAGKFHFAMTN